MLLERERELEILEGAVMAAAGGAGTAVLVEGDPGTGKTALLRGLRTRRSAFRLRVLTARGAELEQQFAFGVVRQLLGPPDALPGAPEWLGEHEGHAVVDPRAAAFQLSAFVADVAADTPLLLVVDDAHWADSASLRWLAQLARDAVDLPIALVCGARPSEPDATPELGELRSASVRVIKPGLLSGSSVAILVRNRLPEADDAFCGACATAAGGNPFLTLALLDTLAAHGEPPDAETAARLATVAPGSVAAGLRARLDRLGPDAIALAQAFAIFGREVRLDDAAALAGMEIGAAARAADALRGARIVEGDPTLGFVHPLLRAAVYEGLPAAGRRERHRQAARVLASRGVEAEQVAVHLVLTHPCADQDVVAVLRRAATDARERGDPESARVFLARALEEPPSDVARLDVLIEHATASEAAGTNPDAVVSALARVIRAAADPRVAARAGRALGIAGVRAMRVREVVDLLVPLGRAIGDADPELRADLEGVTLATAAFDVELFAEMAPRVLADMDAGRSVPAAEAARWRAMRGASASKVETLAASAPRDSPPAMAVTAIALIAVDALEPAREAIERALAAGRAMSMITLIANVLMFRSGVAARDGDLRDAQADVEEASRLMGDVPMRPVIDSHRALIAALRGQAGEADGIASVIDLSHLPETFTLRLIGEHNLARVAIMHGRFAPALERMQMVVDRLDGAGIRCVGHLPSRLPLAQALSGLGRYEEARTVARQELELARRVGAPRHEATAALVAALAHPRPDPDELGEAARMHRTVRSPYGQAWALIEHGAALRRAKDRRAARDPLGEALDIAARHGADGLAARALEELQATGARPQRAMRTGVDALTPSELRVARMAAEGLSNPQIAKTLFVSRKTIETHLAAIYRKLDVSSRVELAGVMPGHCVP